MDIDILILPGGKLQVHINGVSYTDAVITTQHLFILLKKAGIPFEQIGESEQHKDDGSHAHVRGQIHVDH